jgi:DNA polymerase-3 subunit alpha
MRQLKPDCFEDIVAAVALYRPGPLGSGMVDQFIDCKHGRREVAYPHPLLEGVLRETYGVMVYQEQVMQVAQILAGYTLGGADLLRRAMGKKKASEMAKQRAAFVEGAGRNNIAEAKANEIFDLMDHFAGYGFNKSHSAAYAVLTFQTAYLKTYHPTEFYAALMTNDASSTDKVVRHISDARTRDIAVLPPDVSKSEQSFSVADGAIRFGLGAVKGIGSAPIEAIVDARGDGPFTSLFDFCERVDVKRVNRRVLEALIRCGALDATFREGADTSLQDIGKWRARMFAALDTALERASKAQRDRDAGQASLFGLFAEVTPAAVATRADYPEARPWTDRYVLAAEKETIGFYVSGHPLDRYAREVKLHTDCDTARVQTRAPREVVTLAGVIVSRRERLLKSGDGRMAFLQLEDRAGDVEVIVYAKTYPDVRAVIESDEPVLVKGSVRVDGDGEERAVKVVADEIVSLAAARERWVSEVVLDVDARQIDDTWVRLLGEVVAAFPGRCRLALDIDYALAAAEIRLPESLTLAASDDVTHELASRLGAKVRLR